MKLKEILNEYINEGIYDQNTFKAIFLSGLPASGKTEFYNFALKHRDFKSLDADKILTFLVNKGGGSLKDTSIYDKHSNEINKKLNTQNKMWTERGLGVVIDTTGQNAKKILDIKNSLEEKGYKTAMVFIEKDIHDAIKSSQVRNRSVDREYIHKVKTKLESNKEIYKSSFTLFIEVEGRNIQSYKEGEKKISSWLRN